MDSVQAKCGLNGKHLNSYPVEDIWWLQYRQKTNEKEYNAEEFPQMNWPIKSIEPMKLK